jgi:hypothetical protein
MIHSKIKGFENKGIWYCLFSVCKRKSYDWYCETRKIEGGYITFMTDAGHHPRPRGVETLPGRC